MQPLDTSVKGSPGTLGVSADFLDRYAQALDGCGQDITTTDTTREADWSGPASDACGDALADIDTGDIDTLADSVRTVSRAERDLQHALTGIGKQMQTAVAAATGGGLTINGPLIMPPTPPGPAPKAPMGPFAVDRAPQVAKEHQDALTAHQAACADYNRKLAAYNHAKAIIGKARTDEQNAHNTFDQTIAQASVDVRTLQTVGEQAVSWAASYVKTAKGTAEDLFAKADDALETGKLYQNFNSGNLITLTPQEKSLIEWGRTHAQDLEDGYTKKAAEAETFIAKVPKDMVRVISADPGQLAESAQYLKWAKPLLKGMPYFGTAANAAFKVFDVAEGQKSLGRASAEFGAETVGGAVGGWAGGALVGAIAGSEVPVVEPLSAALSAGSSGPPLPTK